MLADYTQAGLEIVFRPHSRIYAMNNTSSKKKICDIHLDGDRELAERMLAAGSGTLSEHPIAHPRWRARRNEVRQREGGKWETLVCGKARKEALHFNSPRLDVNYLLREGGELQAGDARNLSLFMLLTMEVPPGIGLYDAVVADFPVLAPVTAEVKIRSA